MTKLPPPLESIIQKQITDYLELKYPLFFVWKNNTTGIKKPNGSYIPSQSKGSSDLLGIAPNGQFLAIEVKRPDGSYKATEDQRLFLEAIHNHGGLSGIATCVEDVDKILAGEYLIP